MRITGHTTVAGIIGDPIRHTRSPAIHNAAFRELGLDWVYVAFAVPAGRARDALMAMRTLGLVALNVTMPHKTDAARACDELTDVASRLGAVNTVVRADDRLVGDSTDGEGFVSSLAEIGVVVEGRRVVVLGAGGAARAIALACGARGASVSVAARRMEAARDTAALAPGGQAVLLTDAASVIEVADVIVNATPIGVHGEDMPFDPSLLRSGQFVLDTIYHPAETPLLAAARARGIPAANGLGMLVHQAALAFTRFTGLEAPLPVMWSAARADATP